jgi:hypothetical protein
MSMDKMLESKLCKVAASVSDALTLEGLNALFGDAGITEPREKIILAMTRLLGSEHSRFAGLSASSLGRALGRDRTSVAPAMLQSALRNWVAMLKRVRELHPEDIKVTLTDLLKARRGNTSAMRTPPAPPQPTSLSLLDKYNRILEERRADLASNAMRSVMKSKEVQGLNAGQVLGDLMSDPAIKGYFQNLTWADFRSLVR